MLIVPGAAFAMIISDAGPVDYAMLAERLVACLFVAMALSSANYTINEWLDAPFDAMHPTKRARPAVQTAMSPTVVFAQYILLTTVGMLVANMLGYSFALIAAVFAVFGVLYNVRPIRAKDRWIEQDQGLIARKAGLWCKVGCKCEATLPACLHLGSFDAPEEAHRAYCEAGATLPPEPLNHRSGRPRRRPSSQPPTP